MLCAAPHSAAQWEIAIYNIWPQQTEEHRIVYTKTSLYLNSSGQNTHQLDIYQQHRSLLYTSPTQRSVQILWCLDLFYELSVPESRQTVGIRSLLPSSGRHVLSGMSLLRSIHIYVVWSICVPIPRSSGLVCSITTHISTLVQKRCIIHCLFLF